MNSSTLFLAILVLAGAARGAGLLTAAESTDANTLAQPPMIAPVKQTINLTGPTFRPARPADSRTVLRVPEVK